MRKTAAFIAVLIIALPLFAENYYYKDYNVDIAVRENGVMDITETHDVFFTSPSHGLYRDIQYCFDDGNKFDPVVAKVDDVTVAGAPAVMEKGDDYYSIRIGDSNKLVTGDKRYIVSYSFFVPDRHRDYDEIYYNLISYSSDVTMERSEFTITFPKPVDAGRIWVTRGSYGSDERAPFTLSDDGMTILIEAEDIAPYELLTLRVEMDEGYFIGQKAKADPSLFGHIAALVLSVAMAFLSYMTWSRYGRDELIVAPVRFEPPEGLNPMDTGYIIDSSLDADKEVTAMLIYWADKGYLRIIDNGKDDISFEKLKDLPQDASRAERALFSALFKSGDTADSKTLGANGFVQTVSTAVFAYEKRMFVNERSLTDRLADRKKGMLMALTVLFAIAHSVLISLRNPGLLMLCSLFSSMAFLGISIAFSSVFQSKGHLMKMSSRSALIAIWVIIAIAFGALMVYFSGVFSPFLFLALIEGIAFIASLASACCFSVFTTRRSRYGQRLLEEALGYREFIDKVEADKLKVLIDQDPEYFYHTLSYAIVFGLEEKWAKKFKGLYMEPASWYSSSDPVLDYLIYSSLCRRWRHSYHSVIVPLSMPKDAHKGGGNSSFSGFSGFAGGGFSGGGTRSW